MSRRRFIAGSAALGASFLLQRRAFAQAYPSKPVRLMVGYPPGGLPDTTARIVAARLSESLGQQFVVDNRPGAGGALACEVAAKSAPDGYTLAIVDLGQSAINMALYPKLPYDMLRDFAPVSLIATSGIFLAAHGGSGISSFQDLAALARAKPGQITYGSSGNGSSPHLAMEILRSLTRLDMVHVPFKGAGQSFPALLSGQVQLLFLSYSAAAAQVKSGAVKLLGVASDQRSPQAPEVPTFAELGVKGMRVIPTVGLVAPVATPRPIVAALASEVAKGVQHPETVKRFDALGIEPVGNSPEAYAAWLKQDIAYYAAAVKATGAKID